jgi:tetratricopeptide (TPR) repeat protein
MRYSRDGDGAALDESVETARWAVQAAVETYGPADRAGYLTNLCNALMLRFRRDGLNDDLNEAVEAALSTAELAPADHPDRHLHLTNVANVLATRFEAHGDAGDLDRAIEAGRGAVEATRPGHPFHSRYLSNLGGLALTRFALRGDSTDLNAAVEASAEAVGHAADGHGERAAYLTNLGNALLTRFEHGGTRADLADGVLVHREAVDRTPADHPHRIRRLINLCTAARLRFTVEARPEDLDLAIGAGREAAAALPSGHPERPAAFTNLASALHSRFERLHTAGDLGQAVELSRTAVKESAAEHPWRIRRLVNLAAVLRSRFGHSGSPVDLQEAVDVLREAAEVLDDDPTQQAALWGALGNTLLTDTATRTDEELSEAVEAHRRAVAVTPAGHVHRRARLINLSAAHAARFARTAEQRDLNRAIKACRQAIATPGAGTDPDDARYLSNLGVLLRARYELTGADADRKAALRSWRHSASSELGAASVRSGAAYSWGELARENGDVNDAVDGYSTAVRLQARLAWRGADRATREGNLGPWSGLAGDAAACALEAGMPERAVELLEEGRSVLWAQTLQTRHDLTALGEAHPEEAERLAEIRRLLDHHEATANRQAGEIVPAEPEEEPVIEFTQALVRDERIRLAQEWDAIVGRVRRFEGFANFLVPTPFAELAPAADQGDVVTINVSRFRCDALILTETGLLVVALPELRVEVLAEVAAAYIGMLRMTRDYQRLPADRRHRLNDGMREVLRWLWTVIAAPVLDALGLQHRDRDWPRLWWCPTGLLGLLPLHAAQEYDAERMCDSGVPDRVVSSFTPTLGRLLTARAAEPEDLANRRALVVGLSETPSLSALPNVDRELDAIAPHLTMPTTRLRDSAATWQDVTTQLPEHSWLHYAGHSGQYPNRPGMAALFLYDRRLTAVQIADLDLRRVTFAFLSSCESGLGDTALPDEALQLAAALQVAGYRQIIATLWSIGDEVAPSVAAAVYAALDEAPRVEAAQALHDVLHPVRSGHRPLVWAGYCHVGI